MGSNDEFGPDTETIRAWLQKRATYAKDARVIGPGGGTAVEDPPAAQPTDVIPGSAPDPIPRGVPDSTDAGRAVLAALGVDGGPPETDRADDVATSDPHAAGRAVVDAVREQAPPREESPKETPRREAPAGTTRPSRSRRGAPAPARPAASPAPRSGRVVQVGRWTEPEENITAHQASTDVDFPVRGSTIRRVLALFLLASVAATGGASYLAAQDPTPSTLGIAGLLVFLTLVIWAVRAGCVTTEVSLRRGQLLIRRGGGTERVDLLNQRAPVAIVGEPGHRRWTVLVERPGQPLVVIDASMVDPHWFTSALYRLRPELRPGYLHGEIHGDAAVDAGEHADSGIS